MVVPSGDQFVIAAGGYRAVVTECGAGLRELEHDGVPLVQAYAAQQMCYAGHGQLLMPWPNRVAGATYSFDGRQRTLAVTEPERGNAIHGLTRWCAWALEEHSANSVSLTYRLMAQPGYPWTVDLHALYDLSADGLTVTLTATNLSDAPAPYAHGAHPYLTVGDGPVDSWELTVPAATRLTTDQRQIPDGTVAVDDTDYDFRVARPIRALRLDDGFTDLVAGADGRVVVEVRDPASGRCVALWMDARHRWLQVFTGDGLPNARTAVAVEPMTAPADAFNSGAGLVVLDPAGRPDDEHSASWGIRAL